MHLNAVLDVGSTTSPSFWPGGRDHLERRVGNRRSLTLSTVTNSLAGAQFPFIIKDISSSGFLMEGDSTTLAEGEEIHFDLPEVGSVTARVAWASGRYCGCRLDQSISPGVISAALLKADARSRLSPPLLENVTHFPRRVAANRLEPELNFSIAFQLLLFFWAVVGTGVYLAIT